MLKSQVPPCKNYQRFYISLSNKAKKSKLKTKTDWIEDLKLKNSGHALYIMKN